MRVKARRLGAGATGRAARLRPVVMSTGMKLKHLLSGVNTPEPPRTDDPEITQVVYDSRKAEPGALFVAICGEKTDGNRFVFDALDRGARAVISALPAPPDLPPTVSWVQVPDARKALATVAANFYGHPARALQLLAVTGTNGKTTTTYLLDSILRSAGHRTGLFGTIAYRTPRASRVATTTTPESLELNRFLAEMRDVGGTHVVLEASSHALAMDRLWGCPFAVAVFTNLTRDHLDYHRTFDHYFAAKRRLFESTGAGAPALGVINVDDPYGPQLAGLAARTLTYGVEREADVTAKKFSLSFSGLHFIAQTPMGKFEVRSRLVGKMNVYNILAAVAAAAGLGVEREKVEAGIEQLQNVPGRFERIDLGQPFVVIVDYAHTDDALRNLVATARELNPSARVITVFGCGGDRDRAKRPLMGEVAGKASELVVLTSDNPRSEDPLRIMNDVAVGLQRVHAKYLAEPDRARAVETALDHARAGDIVLLAGKGHETYQVLRDRTVDFDDRDVVREALRRRGFDRQDTQKRS